MIFSALSPDQADRVPELITEIVAAVGEERFRVEAGKRIVAAIALEAVLPPSLSRFVPLVGGGLEFFFSRLSVERLSRALTGLLAAGADRSNGELVFHLALQFPTLHKLAQIIARRPDIDPAMKRWLVQLEQGRYGTPVQPQLERIERELARLDGVPELTVSADPIAEASVASVFPFRLDSAEQPRQQRGVFKVIKPGVRPALAEELQALTDTAAFLDRNRHRFGLGELRLAALADELEADLRKEIDLAAEQQALHAAAQLYAGNDRVLIPKVMPFSSPDLTAMEYVDGRPVDRDDIGVGAAPLAELVFTATLCVPLFHRGEEALFHGDPHGGNIIVVAAGDRPVIALVDWTLAARLSRWQRTRIMRIMVGVLAGDSRTIAGAISELAVDQAAGDADARAALPDETARSISDPDYLARDPLARVFHLLERAAMLGLVFPAELILYRKSFFTLEGVLNDICPGFSPADSMENYLRELLWREMPHRFAASFVPVPDEAARYRSLLSTADLQSLIMSQTMAGWQQAMVDYATLIGQSMELTAAGFALCAGMGRRPAPSGDEADNSDD